MEAVLLLGEKWDSGGEELATAIGYGSGFDPNALTEVLEPVP